MSVAFVEELELLKALATVTETYSMQQAFVVGIAKMIITEMEYVIMQKFMDVLTQMLLTIILKQQLIMEVVLMIIVIQMPVMTQVMLLVKRQLILHQITKRFTTELMQRE